MWGFIHSSPPSSFGPYVLLTYDMASRCLPGLYAGSNYCQSHVLVCQPHVLVDTLMLTVKLVYKLSDVPDDLKWATNTHLTPFTLTF